MKSTYNLKHFIAGVVLVLGSSSAWAHHPMDGETPSTFWQGLLSGLGHPIIGIDHLAFIIAIGFLCAFLKIRSPLVPLTLVSATVLGAVLQWNGFTLPYLEILVALSVISVGILLFRTPENLIAFGFSASIAAIFHGLAYGEAIIGAEPKPLGAYLIGFSLIQMMIAGTAFFVGRIVLRNRYTILNKTRYISASAVSVVGLIAFSAAIAG